MHDIWNPWHGCVKCSEGCQNCYMYYLDRVRDLDGSKIFKVKGNFDYPIQKKKDKSYKIQSGEMIRVCMTSDFFLEEADEWREDVWNLIYQRPDVIFYILTKRPQRVLDCLPKDWGLGWENVFFNVTCENQRRADERIPILLDLPFKHKGLFAAPLISSIDINKYLNTNKIEQVLCGGENYDGSRECNYDWVKQLYEQCKNHNVTFNFIETGTNFVKEGKKYFIPNKRTQAQQAYKSGLNYKGKEIDFKLFDNMGQSLSKSKLYVPKYTSVYCKECASRLTCNGCSNCGKCKQDI